MSIEVKNKDLLETKDMAADALKITGIPVSESIKFIKMIKKVKGETEDLMTAINNLINEYGEDIPVEEGSKQVVRGVKAGTEKAVEFEAKRKELMEATCVVEIDKVTITLSGEKELPLNVLYAYEPFLTIKEAKAKAPSNQKKGK